MLLFGTAERPGLVVDRIRALGRCQRGKDRERDNDGKPRHRRRCSSQHTDQLTEDYTRAGSRRSLGASYREKAVLAAASPRSKRQAEQGPVARMSNDTLGALPEPFLGRFPKVNTGKVTGI
jgi:hypothetical protein